MTLRTKARQLRRWLGRYFPSLVRRRRLEDYSYSLFRHGLYEYINSVSFRTSYAGIKTKKCPNDFWIYQQLVYELKPTVIIEIGNYHGGSTLALADIQQRFSKGKIIAIDIDHDQLAPSVRNDPRIVWITGDALAVVDQVREHIKPDDVVLIIEDSSHTFDNTYKILKEYSELVTPGSYFIVEDGTTEYFPRISDGKGPLSAVKQFVKENENFIIDRSREIYVITLNYCGFLKRVSNS